MSLDLSAAVSVASDRIWSRATKDIQGRITTHDADTLARIAVRAAAPLIEAAVRAQVAAEIRTVRLALIPGEYAPGHYAGLAQAERIARGVS